MIIKFNNTHFFKQNPHANKVRALSFQAIVT